MVSAHTTNNPQAYLNAPVEAVAKRSIHEDCRVEEDRFKWIESEKVGYDLGETAIHRWVREHWTDYLRAKWLEHLQGKCFWTELDRGDFGLLLRQFQDQQHLLIPILDRLKAGQENLHIICWANAEKIPFEDVLHILEALDVNSRRLLHRFDAH
jgi:hypothetical protein